MRNALTPVQMAALADAADNPGWGPHSYTDELLCRIGEAVDQVAWTLVALKTDKAKPPARWRRPGVLGARDQAEAEYDQNAHLYEQIETERAEHAARRAAYLASQQAKPT